MRPIRQALLTLSVFLLMNTSYGQDIASGHARGRSPFNDMQFEEGRARVLVGDRWYMWLAIDDVPYDTILAEARERFPGQLQQRIAEDLLVVLAGLDVYPGETVTLELRSLEDGAVLVLPDVPMTNDNRTAVWYNRRVREMDAQRDRLGRAEANPDLVFDELIGVIRARHAYADLKGIDFQRLKREIVEQMEGRPTYRSTILAMQRFIARLGDGHARVDDWLEHAPPGRLGFLLQHAGGGVVAFYRDPGDARGSFLDADHPYVVSMDGVPIEDWIEAASVYVVDGSPALVRRRSAELLRYANLVRDEMDLPHAPEIAITLRNADGTSTKGITLPITGEHGVYGIWPRAASGVLDSGFGYIRLESMSLDADALAELERTLTSMSDAPGLIIDVRGNGGGSRDATSRLVPRFLNDNQPAPARVVNVARARLSFADDPTDPEGHLANRQAYPATWAGWSPAERAEIERFNRTFKPHWLPPMGLYSEPHYMVVSRQDGLPIYDKPVVILMDEGCFSATDIFLGALKGLPNITLIGTPSSGGSAKSNRHDIESMGIEVRLATMVSYAPDGRLYDGIGIRPDVHVQATATDLIGHTDTQLEAAVEHLRSKQ